LRERSEDIPVLAESFLRKHSDDERTRFSDAALRKMMRGPWPGNARELENCIERALALASSSEIVASDILIPDDVMPSDGSIEEMLLRIALERRLTVRDLTDAYIDAALEATHGRKSEAARILGMNRRTLYRREEKHDQDETEKRQSAFA